MYQPVVIFRAKCFAPTPVHAIFRKHYEATFPKIYKTEYGAINYARKQIVYDPDVWQLPCAKVVKDDIS